jgi:pyridoxamine 5'-phosphate oxidase
VRFVPLVSPLVVADGDTLILSRFEYGYEQFLPFRLRGWGDLERQVRIEGKVELVPIEEATAYFHSRPASSQLGAWASDRSTVISDRSSLETRLQQLEAKYVDREIPKPARWGGFRVVPTEIEFWQGRPSRLHDRLRYELINGSWKIDRLAP